MWTSNNEIVLITLTAATSFFIALVVYWLSRKKIKNGAVKDYFEKNLLAGGWTDEDGSTLVLS